MTESNLVVLSAGDAALALDITGPDLPRVLHWGVDPGLRADDAAQVLDAMGRTPRHQAGSLMPSQGKGWFGCPALTAHRSRPVPSPPLRQP
ncbi:hypothetical protein ABZX88_12760 [Kitasatospora aureofaciens]|uniref:hypothetical protein n=1 Tax=Kitasatospora aureofaciens TaxID=1894 RepID=UPI0033ABF786